MSTVQGSWRGPNIVKDGLVLYLDAGSPNSYWDKTGTTWRDISGNENNVSLVNSPTFSSANGGSIVFDGQDEVGVVDNILANLDIVGNLTIDAVSYPTSFSNQGNIVSRFNPGYRIRFQSNGTFWMFSNFNSLTSTTSFTTNNWYHTVAVFSSTGLRMYVNNVLVGSNTTAFTPDYTTLASLRVGGFSSTQELFTGRIANIKLYNRALTAADVSQNFNAIRTRFGI